jgi:hypothetical protein
MGKMLFLVLSTWGPDRHNEIAKRVAEKGLMIPEGTKVIGEWTYIGGGRNFRLLEADDANAILEGALPWADIANMEIVPVVEVQSAIEAVKS